MVSHHRGLPVVACIGLTLTAGCTNNNDPIVGHWDLRARVMPDETIEYPYVVGYAECSYTIERALKIGAALKGREVR